MKLKQTKVGDVTVIEIEGKLVGDPPNAGRFHALVTQLLDSGTGKIVVDLRHVPWANSQGIGLLIDAHVRTRAASGRLVLAHVDDRLRELLTISRLNDVIENRDSVDDALSHLGQAPPGAGPAPAPNASAC